MTSASFNCLFSLLFAASLFAVSSTGCTTATPPDADASDSVAYYTQLLEDLPEDPAIYYNRGVCYFRLARYDEAITDFSKALRLDPGFYPAYLPRADCHRLLGSYALAIPWYDSALAGTGKSSYAYNSRGYCNFRLKNYSGAVSDYTYLILHDSGSWETYLRRGISYYKTNDFDSAAWDLLKTVELGPDSGIGHLWLGNALFRLGRYDDAVNAYLIAKEKGAPLAEENHIAETYYERAKSLASSNASQAILDLNESIAADSTSGKSYYLRGKLLSRLELNEQACPDFSAAAKLGVLEAFPEAKRSCDPANW